MANDTNNLKRVQTLLNVRITLGWQRCQRTPHDPEAGAPLARIVIPAHLGLATEPRGRS
jgi:hypothetical protein